MLEILGANGAEDFRKWLCVKLLAASIIYSLPQYKREGAMTQGGMTGRERGKTEGEGMTQGWYDREGRFIGFAWKGRKCWAVRQGGTRYGRERHGIAGERRYGREGAKGRPRWSLVKKICRKSDKSLIL